MDRMEMRGNENKNEYEEENQSLCLKICKKKEGVRFFWEIPNINHWYRGVYEE